MTQTAPTTETLNREQLADHNTAQVVLWLAQAAQITMSQNRNKEADAIYREMLRVLAAREEADRDAT